VTPRMLTVPEVMTALQVGRSTVYDLIRSGELGSVLIRRRRRVPESALTDYVARLLREAS
jgi:excisionase family DNA binding protein